MAPAMSSGSGSGGILVGGEPMALLAASSAVHEAAFRIDNVAARLAAAVVPVAPGIAAAMPFAPAAAAAAALALAKIVASPGAGLPSVAASLEGLALQLQLTGQALEAAGAVGLLASGGLALLRGERATVLASADGVDLRREAMTGAWSAAGVGGASTLGVRQVRTPDGSTIYVVEATMQLKQATSAGVQVNGVGAFAELGEAQEVTLRWAVPTEADARVMVAVAAAALAPGVGLMLRLPTPTETVLARTASATVVGGTSTTTSAAAGVTVRGEVASLASGGQRYALSVSGAGNAALHGVAGTGGAGSFKVTVERSSSGAITKAGWSTTSEVDRGRHGVPLLEAGNRVATLVERDHTVELDPDTRAAADRVATAVARGEAPSAADVDRVRDAAGDVATEERTYDVRHQPASAEASVHKVDAGGGVAIDTAELRR
jgi:hypothetical protein